MACSWFSSFFEKAFVSLVDRRIPMRIESFCRSVWLVKTCLISGVPETTAFRAPMH